MLWLAAVLVTFVIVGIVFAFVTVVMSARENGVPWIVIIGAPLTFAIMVTSVHYFLAKLESKPPAEAVEQTR